MKTKDLSTKRVNLIALTSILIMFAIVFATMFVPSFAKESTQISGIVTWVGSIAAGLVAVFMMVSLVKDGISFATGKGQVSIVKIIGKALFMIIMIGLIFIVQGYNDDGGIIKGTGQTLANKGINTINTAVTDTDLGGSGSSTDKKD
ncbi:MAG: hypothetical protein VZS44_08170 [Bacilli bacterium]|nr:hypothetical protein [Bacilli bacterium]